MFINAKEDHVQQGKEHSNNYAIDLELKLIIIQKGTVKDLKKKYQNHIKNQLKNY